MLWGRAGGREAAAESSPAEAPAAVTPTPCVQMPDLPRSLHEDYSNSVEF